MSQNNQIQDKKLWDFHELENRESFILAQPRLKFLAKQACALKRSGKILDIGFGDGFFFKALYNRNKNLNLYGLDISEKNIERTKRELGEAGIDVNLTFGSIDNMPFPNDYFDVVVSSEVLEHLDDFTLQKGLSEIRRILKPDGYFLGTVPVNEKLSDLLCFCPQCGCSFHRWGHKQSFDKKRIQNLFVSFFDKVKIRLITFYWATKPKGNVVKIVLYFIKLITFHTTRYILGADYRFYVKAHKR